MVKSKMPIAFLSVSTVDGSATGSLTLSAAVRVPSSSGTMSDTSTALLYAAPLPPLKFAAEVAFRSIVSTVS